MKAGRHLLGVGVLVVAFTLLAGAPAIAGDGYPLLALDTSVAPIVIVARFDDQSFTRAEAQDLCGMIAPALGMLTNSLNVSTNGGVYCPNDPALAGLTGYQVRDAVYSIYADYGFSVYVYLVISRSHFFLETSPDYRAAYGPDIWIDVRVADLASQLGLPLPGSFTYVTSIGIPQFYLTLAQGFIL